MDITLGIFFILFALSVRGEDEVCQDVDLDFRKCENGNVLTRVTQDRPTTKLFSASKYLRLQFSGDKEIAPNAFSSEYLTTLRIDLPYINQRYGSSLNSLTLHTDSLSGLPNLTDLYINNANITFDGNPFAQATTLTNLELKNGASTEIPVTLIGPLTNLEKLSFEKNHLTRIPKDSFVNHGHVKSLNLRSNNMEKLESGWSNGLGQLEELNLMNNAIAAERDMFAGVQNLKRLFISDAFDPSGFRADILRNLSDLTTLGIDHVKIASLEPGMFDAFLQLRRISLDANSLTHVPTGVFERLSSLKDLTFTHNRIETIEPGAFYGLNLTYLGLSLNMITTIQAKTFDGLEVGRLDLDGNRISDLKPHAFSGLTARSVDLSKNRLLDVGPDDFSGLTTDNLDLSGNNIDTIAPGAFRNTKLKVLGLIRTSIKVAKKQEWGLAESVEIMM